MKHHAWPGTGRSCLLTADPAADLTADPAADLTADPAADLTAGAALPAP